MAFMAISLSVESRPRARPGSRRWRSEALGDIDPKSAIDSRELEAAQDEKQCSLSHPKKGADTTMIGRFRRKTYLDRMLRDALQAEPQCDFVIG
jgi:hypothetical protein